jgi:hypothetical protein
MIKQIILRRRKISGKLFGAGLRMFMSFKVVAGNDFER